MAIKISGNTVIDDSQNISVSGNATANSFVGDGSNLTNLPGGGNVTEVTASGTLADGSKVIVNADGTVSVVNQTFSETYAGAAGTPIVHDSNLATSAAGAVYDSANQRVVVMYYNADFGGNNATGRAVVGTVSGTSISFGTPTEFVSASVTDFSLTFDSTNNKVVACYRNYSNSNYGTAIVGTVNPSNNTISFGTPVVFESAATYHIRTAYDSTNQKIVITYYDDGNSGYGTAIVGTVSGTSISFGSSTTFNDFTDSMSVIYDSINQKIVIAFRDNALSNGQAIVGTISGTSISFGSPVEFESGNASQISATFDSTNGKVVIAYQDQGNSNYGTAVVGTVSGTSISFGTPVVFESDAIQRTSTTFDSAAGKVVIAYSDNGNSYYGTAVVGTVSGDSISFQTPFVYESGSTSYISAVYDASNQKVVVAYTDASNSQKGTSVVITTEASTPSLGSYTNFYTSDTDNPAAAYDPVNGKVVVVYRGDTSNNIYGIVGTVSGTSISFGTPVQLSSSNPTYYNQIVYDANAERFVVAWSRLSSGAATSVVVQVSGDTLVVGSDSTFETESTSNQMSYTNNWLVYDPDSQKVVVAYIYDIENEYGRSKIGTVDPSTNSITWSSGDTWSSSSCAAGSLVYDTNANKFVICYGDKTNSRRLSAKVGTMNGSGTSITWGSQITPEAVYSGNISAVYVPSSQKILIIYSKSNAGSPNWNWSGRAIVGTISGTSMNFGSPIEWISNEVVYMDSAYDSNKQNVVFVYRDQTNNYGEIVPVTISGTTPSFGSATTFTTHSAGSLLTHTTGGNMVVVVEDQANSNYGRALVYNQATMVGSTNLTAENYIGISDGAFTNGQTATIQLIGSVDDAQSGLTPGQKYYVQDDGTLAESGSVFAGTAVSSTSLVVKS